ncbi:hypothetical protein ATK74_2792 [Propionicimonas paludicola]|uniref:UPF0246 protein ATK74_2792 n=1 Tax=Propionicimonas paludicola TaxID=185243 RepID=A0A2A9CUY6_9ACTN|nr:peroxide stress protein YaaA [Propionicimonas paludicola]PFG18208.1 hypothetical protein ATK74_2792 [Propionicimonas paludicola]
MLSLISPAKALDFESPVPKTVHTLPRLLDDSMALAAVMKNKSVADLARLSGISDELAARNAERWAAFDVPFPTSASRVALLAFNGDAYQGLAARQRFGTRDYTEAQKTLRILSGLYGLLRPLDLILAYRLEMGTRLETEQGGSLYQWWGRRITDLIAEDLAASPGSAVLVNLASTEYFSAVQPSSLDARVISPRFEDTDPRGRRSVISFFAKRARGELAAWLVLNRVHSARAIIEFDGAGYRYDKAASTPDQPVFVRPFAARTQPGS